MLPTLPLRSSRRAAMPRATLAVLAVLATLAGCAAPAPQCTITQPLVYAPPPVQAAPTAGQTQLANGVRLYENADFVGAIRQLQGASDIWVDSPEVRMNAYKYLAFSYCVTNRRAACRQAFESLLKIDPDFELLPTEAGHPIWGPVFRQARKAIEPTGPTASGHPATGQPGAGPGASGQPGAGQAGTSPALPQRGVVRGG